MVLAPESGSRGGGGSGFLPKVIRILLVAILYSLAMYRVASMMFGDAFSLESGGYPQQSSVASPKHEARVATAMIIATVPYNQVHAMALWSHLECLTEGIDRVLIAAPDAIWSKIIVERIKNEFVRRAEEAASTSNTSQFERLPVIEAGYYRNNRYDAGLWCDGLRFGYGYDGGLGKTGDDDDDDESASGGDASDTANATIAAGAKNPDNPPVDPIADAIYIINDSAISMKRYDNLTRRVVDSTRHELYSPNFTATKSHPRLVSLNGRFDDLVSAQPWPKYNWVESVYRGMTPKGLDSFYRHTCLPESFRSCLHVTADQRKRCIVEYFEKSLATSAYDIQTEVDAMYPSYWPHTAGLFPSFGPDWNGTAENERLGGFWSADQWIDSRKFHAYLRSEWGFPLKKVKRLKGEVGQCNSLVGDGLLDTLDYPDEKTMARYKVEMAESELDLRSDEERERIRAHEEEVAALSPEKRSLLGKWCGKCKSTMRSCDARAQYLQVRYRISSIEAKISLLEDGHCGSDVVSENGVEMKIAFDDFAGAGNGTGA